MTTSKHMEAARALLKRAVEQLEDERREELARIDRLRLRASGQGPDAVEARAELEEMAKAAFAGLRPRA